jgi:hypothetical protein
VISVVVKHFLTILVVLVVCVVNVELETNSELIDDAEQHHMLHSDAHAKLNCFMQLN